MPWGPVEAGLLWAISKPRRTGNERAGGFPGAETILTQIPSNIDRRLVGLTPQGRSPVREGAIIEDQQGNSIGAVTSGGFSPSLGHPIALAMLLDGRRRIGEELWATAPVAGRACAVTVVSAHHFDPQGARLRV